MLQHGHRVLLLVAAVVVAQHVTSASPLCPAGDNALLYVQSTNCSATYLEDVGSTPAVAFCTTAFSVTSKDGLISFAPISTTDYKYTGPSQGPTSFLCTKATARARVADATKPKQAVLQLWGDTIRESRISATGRDTVEVTVYELPRYRTTPLPQCQFTYKVTKGCLLGAKAPANSPPVQCPAGTIRKTGLQGLPYCEPCPSNTYSLPNTASCKPCPAEGQKASQPAVVQSQCPSCLEKGSCYNGCSGNQYNDPEKGCQECPPGTTLTPTQDGCARCFKGARCCEVNPSPICPPCPADKPSEAISFTIAAVGVTGAVWERCQLSDVYQCNQLFRVTIYGNCSTSIRHTFRLGSMGYVSYLDTLPLPRKPAGPSGRDTMDSCEFGTGSGVLGSEQRVVNAGAFDLSKDLLRVFRRATTSYPASKIVTSATDPSLFTAQFPNSTCQPSFRIVEATGPVPPLQPLAACPPGAPECKAKCPAGRYKYKAASGKQLCLPCPAGTYTNKADQQACKKCRPGFAATGTGNTKCRACPAGTWSRGYSCDLCPFAGWSPAKSSKACPSCPVDTISVGGGCITRSATKPCCVTGTCGSIPKCPAGTNPSGSFPPTPALLQLTSATSACSRFPLIDCITRGSKRLYAASYNSASLISLAPLSIAGKGARCAEAAFDVSQTGQRSFGISAYSGPPLDNAILYGFGRLSSTGVLKITLYQPVRPYGFREAVVPPLPACVATFKLAAGALMGVQQPAASCPRGLLLKTVNGVKACDSCLPGRIAKGGKCVKCKLPTYNSDYNGYVCRRCPRGTYNIGENGPIFGSTGCAPCTLGSAPNAKQTTCEICPAGTFAPPQAAKCMACPAGTSTRGAAGAPFCWF